MSDWKQIFAWLLSNTYYIISRLLNGRPYETNFKIKTACYHNAKAVLVGNFRWGRGVVEWWEVLKELILPANLTVAASYITANAIKISNLF